MPTVCSAQSFAGQLASLPWQTAGPASRLAEPYQLTAVGVSFTANALVSLDGGSV